MGFRTCDIYVRNGGVIFEAKNKWGQPILEMSPLKRIFNISLIIIIISISTLIMGIANLQLEYSQLLSLTQEYCENLK